MANRNAEAGGTGEPLHAHLPQARPRAITATRIGHDQQFRGLGIVLPAHVLPPGQDTVDGKIRRVVVNPHADPTAVLPDIIDSVGNDLAQLLVFKVVHQGFFGLALRLPLPASVFEIPDQLFLLGIHGNDWQAPAEKGPGLSIEILKLRIAVRVLGAFNRLGIGLQTVPHLVQQVGHFAIANVVALALQLGRQVPRAFAGPAQG